MHSDDETPMVPNKDTGKLPGASSKAEIDAFLSDVRTMAPAPSTGERGKLIFAMDATMSRQPTWDMALGLQAEMFSIVKKLGGLDVQLVYFRGFNECRASKWANNPETLARLMGKVSCQGGHTQIGKVLRHARKQGETKKINAIVYVGDAIEENIDHVAATAGELGLMGVPIFIFQEGYDSKTQTAFREIARLSKGAYGHFGAGAADQLRALLSAVAVYAAGGRQALKDLSRKESQQIHALLEQLS